ncbi:MAG: FtsX-like permease family protein, partial [Bryobacteraceae bacterium]
GKKIIIHMKAKDDADEVIGVVGDVRHAGLDVAPRAMTYWPHSELAYSSMMLAIRTDGQPLAYVSALRDLVRQMDADLPLSDIATMEQRMSVSISQQRFSALLLGIFAGIALLLAAVGIYGVVAYAVSLRTHEFGIRIALGAGRGDVLRLVLRHGARLAMLGVAIGLVGSLAATRLIQTLLFGVESYDPATFASVAALLSGVALLACWLPARRATRVDPIVALRFE